MYASLGGYDYANGTQGNYVGPYSASYYTPYQSSAPQSNSSFNGWGSMAGSAISSVGSYLSQMQEANNQAELRKLDAKTQKEMLQKQREYQTQDRAYRKQAASKWSKFFEK